MPASQDAEVSSGKGPHKEFGSGTRRLGAALRLFITVVGLGGATYGTLAAFQKAGHSMQYPATRGGTLTISSEGEFTAFPGFGIVVCPLDPTQLVLVSTNNLLIDEEIALRVAPAAPPPPNPPPPPPVAPSAPVAPTAPWQFTASSFSTLSTSSTSTSTSSSTSSDTSAAAATFTNLSKTHELNPWLRGALTVNCASAISLTNATLRQAISVAVCNSTFSSSFYRTLCLERYLLTDKTGAFEHLVINTTAQKNVFSLAVQSIRFFVRDYQNGQYSYRAEFVEPQQIVAAFGLPLTVQLPRCSVGSHAFVTSFYRDGSPEHQIQYQAAMPLFGFVQNPGGCVQVSWTGTFDPSLRAKYLPVTVVNGSVVSQHTNSSIDLLVSSFSGSSVVMGLYETKRGLSSLGQFLIFRPGSFGLLNYPTVRATLAKVLKPWTGSAAQIAASIQGAASKRQATAVFDNKWSLDLSLGGGIGDPVTDYSASPPVNTFVVNLQPYFVNFDVVYTEEYYAFDYSMAVTSLLTYLTTLSVCLGIASASQAWVPILISVATVATAAARARSIADDEVEALARVAAIAQLYADGRIEASGDGFVLSKRELAKYDIFTEMLQAAAEARRLKKQEQEDEAARREERERRRKERGRTSQGRAGTRTSSDTRREKTSIARTPVGV